MPMQFLLDENHRGLLFRYIQRRNLASDYPIDVVRVGDISGPALGTTDTVLLRWTQRHDRILVSADLKTLPRHLLAHLAAGEHSPSVFLTVPAPLRDIYEYPVAATYASEPSEWRDRFVFIPLWYHNTYLPRLIAHCTMRSRVGRDFHADSVICCALAMSLANNAVICWANARWRMIADSSRLNSVLR